MGIQDVFLRSPIVCLGDLNSYYDRSLDVGLLKVSETKLDSSEC